MNYYERHLGDYARDTAHLSMLEHGAYTLLLDRYYATEQGLPADQVHRLARARTREERSAVDSVLSEFFTLSNGLWVKNRVQEEIDKANKSIEAARVNGKKGGRPKKPNGFSQETQEKPNGFPLGSENETQQEPSEKLTRHQTPDTKEKKARKRALPPDFGISPRVESWAAEHGHSNLAAHLEHFVSYAKRSGATYADWDEAFMNAIRKNWAEVPATVVPIRRLAF